ncbi:MULTISPECIES: hypothetical protein [Burkholderia]|uniref:hypothetical protein n=1 Tax=Burkholderia TaxID=32008 RepID=UPI0012386391|nr:MULTISPECIES: hypothetical protein [Burkholderia]MBU9284121.1 hypothetical protein [Burkholderia multivorans]MCZ2901366.1 hypothetical protein [Burkholderia thailandensis]MDD1482203.1 hypothetical protein [Burkholderia thailandensis]MDD1490621.1 hypothetical protein [Burkholderia thailandensis]MDD1496245.1 hypothetical protein [Burkholderia thailandensis]
MTQQKTPQEIVEFSAKLHETLRGYLDMDSWTPVTGALLLSGIQPPSGCTELPKSGGVGLDGTEIVGFGIGQYHEARTILKQWKDWCEERGRDSEIGMKPIEFIDWCVEDEIKERFAVHHRFQWIDVFKDMVGYPSGHLPFEVALYAAKTAQPLELILERLNEIDRRAIKAARRGSIAVVPIASSVGDAQVVINPLRQHLTTEELAAALGVQPQTIYKRHSEDGHYRGVAPAKQANRSLAWPLDSVDRILKGTVSDK